MEDGHSIMNIPTSHTYNTSAVTTLTQMNSQYGGHAPLRTNGNDKYSS